MRRALLPLVLTSLLAAGEEAAPPPIKLEFRPQAFSRQTELQYSKDGAQVQRETTSCRLSLVAKLDVEPIASNRGREGQVKITEAVTDSGESLLQGGRDNHHLSMNSAGWMHRGWRGDTRKLELYVQLRPPAQPATAIARMAGEVTFMVSDGKQRKVEIGPIGKMSGAPIAVEGLPGIEMTLTWAADKLTIAAPQSLFDNLAELRLQTAQGARVETGGMSGGGGDGQMSYEMNVSLPADGTVILILHQNVRAVTVPFEVRGIPLQAPPKEEVKRIILKSTEVEPDQVKDKGGDKPQIKPGADDF